MGKEEVVFLVLTSWMWAPFVFGIAAIFIDGIFGTRIIDTFLQLATHR